jgi:hypothetical protein
LQVTTPPLPVRGTILKLSKRNAVVTIRVRLKAATVATVNILEERVSQIVLARNDRVYTVLFGNGTKLVDIDRTTRITGKYGRARTTSQLQPGVRIRITGVRNTRSDEITSTASVVIQ